MNSGEHIAVSPDKLPEESDVSLGYKLEEIWWESDSEITDKEIYINYGIMIAALVLIIILWAILKKGKKLIKVILAVVIAIIAYILIQYLNMR